MVSRRTESERTPENADDLALIRICRDPQDDRFEHAFEMLFRRYRDQVFSIAYRMTGKTNDALDVVQDCFSLLFRKLGSFREDAQFSTWLFRIVVNCCIDHQRREKSKRSRISGSLTTLEASAEPQEPGQGPVGHAEQAELGEHIGTAIQKLSPKLRAILVLRYQQGQSYEELAATLEISLGTVKSRLARGHAALERNLSGTLERFDINSPSPGEGPDAHDQGAA